MRKSHIVFLIVGIIGLSTVFRVLEPVLTNVGQSEQIRPTRHGGSRPRVTRPALTRGAYTQKEQHVSEKLLSLLKTDIMPDLRLPPVMGTFCNKTSLRNIRESSTNIHFLKIFTTIFRERFGNLPWWLDEGGLIGSARAGSMANADDDFDFFALLPNQTAPCRPSSTTCTEREFNVFIHRFLRVFWDEGLCINKFHPDVDRFRSNRRLMYSFQLNRDNNLPPERCFVQGKPFAHMHLGILVENSSSGEIETNTWAKHTTHPVDRFPLDIALPVTKCRVGMLNAPCPRDIVRFLSLRNNGEYVKKSSDGSCLLVRNKWGQERKVGAVSDVENLDACGYNSMVALAENFRRSGYKSC